MTNFFKLSNTIMKITHEVHVEESLDSFTNSRLALAKLLAREGRQIIDLKNELELENYQNLKHYPDFVVSISHTKGAGAAVLGNKKEVRSVGIDIEWSTRHVKAEAQKFFRHPNDSKVTDLLQLWTMKEAAFKALSPLGYPGVLVLSKIIIDNGTFYTEANPALKGNVTFEIIDTDNKKLYQSIAVVT